MMFDKQFRACIPPFRKENTDITALHYELPRSYISPRTRSLHCTRKKMLFDSAFQQLLCLAVTAAAIPTLNTPTPYNFNDSRSLVDKRNVGGVRLSDGLNFTGHVWYGVWPLNECISLGD